MIHVSVLLEKGRAHMRKMVTYSGIRLCWSMVVMLVAAPLTASIPVAALAAILLVVAYNTGEWGEIRELWRQGWPSGAGLDDHICR